MSPWHLNILGTWIEGLNHLGKLLFLKKWILRFCGMTLIRYCWESTCEQRERFYLSPRDGQVQPEVY